GAPFAPQGHARRGCTQRLLQRWSRGGRSRCSCPCPITERGTHFVHRSHHLVKEIVIDGSALAERLVQVHTYSTQLLYCRSKRRRRRLLHSRVVLQLIDLRGPRVQRVEHDGTSPCARLDAEHVGTAADRIAI